jgi:hypothetical protein
MANVVTISRPDVVALVEEAAERLTGGNKTEAVALAMRRLLEQHGRAGSCSVRIADRSVCQKAWTSSRRLSTSSPTPGPAARSHDDRRRSAGCGSTALTPARGLQVNSRQVLDAAGRCR